MRLFAVAFFFLFLALSSHAQLITAYSVDQGLPQSTVTSLYRDPEGYLWCGTGSGLALFDGHAFHTPVQSEGKEDVKLTSITRGIIPSTDGKTCWVGSENSVNQIDRYNYRVLRSFDLVKQKGWAEVPVLANDTALWVTCSGKGLFRVRIRDGKVTPLTHSGFNSHPGISSDQQLIFFRDTSGALITFNTRTNAIRSVLMPQRIARCLIYEIRPSPAHKDELLILTETGMMRYNYVTGLFQSFSFGDPAHVDSTLHVSAMDVDPDGYWWIGIVGQGVFRYDPQQHTLRPCMWQQDGTHAGKIVTTPTRIVCDAYGVVWCGTDGAGIVKLLHNRMVFREKYRDLLVTDTCTWFTRCFYELSPQRYLVGSLRGGLMLVDHDQHTMHRVTSGNLWKDVTPFFITGSGDGRLLVGTDQSLLLIDTLSWITEQVQTGSSAGGRFTGYLRLRSGEIWVYGNRGISRFSNDPLPMLSPPFGKPARVSAAVELRDGRIIVAGSPEGLRVFTSAGVFVADYDFIHHIGMPAETQVRGMVADESGMLWLASESGVYLLTPQFKMVERFSVENGLPDNSIYAMTMVSSSLLALGTGHGFALLNTYNRSIQSWHSADGLPSEECNTGALYFSASKQLYIGTTGGFVRWNPLHTVTCYRASRVLASYGANDRGATGIIQEPIIRDYGSGSIELEIWNTDFAFPERTLYTRQLDGAETVSTQEMGVRRVTYAALSSGLYSFLCSTEIPGCAPGALTKLLTIKIIPPFWMSGWFIGLSSVGAVLIITLILFAVIRLRYQRKIRTLKMQQELDQIRHRISRDIHDEIGAGLTRIALSGELMARKVTADQTAHEKLRGIAGTARELSQSMKEVVWSVNPHYDSLDHMTAYFRSYVSGVAEEADIRFTYIADETFPDMEVNPETRRNLLLILKEAVSNAMKYAAATELKLELHWDKRRFTMEFSDNGKGFDLKDQSKVNSNGLRNIRQRAEASGLMVAITSSPGSGTQLRIYGPLDRS